MEMTLNVRKARAIALKTQVEIAKELGISARTYANLEKNPENFTTGQARRFAQVVDVSYNNIFLARTTLKAQSS